MPKKQVFALNLREDSPVEKELANFLKETPDNKKKVILAFLTHGASLLGKHMNESDSPTCNGVFFNRVVFSDVLGMINSTSITPIGKAEVILPKDEGKTDNPRVKKLQGLTS